MTTSRFKDLVLLPLALMLKGVLAGPERFSNGLERRLVRKGRDDFVAYLNSKLGNGPQLIAELEEAGFRRRAYDENSQHFHYSKTLSMGQIRQVDVVLHRDFAEASFRMWWL